MAESGTHGCFHCGETLPPSPVRVRLGDVEQLACCSGCAAAASFIRDAGLGDYYRLRSGSSSTPSSTDLSCWDRDDVLRENSREIDGEREITVVSNDMHCAACAWLIDRALRREPAVSEVQANAVTGRVRLRWKPALQPLSQLLQRLASLGYTVNLAPDAQREQQRLRERRTLMIRLGVAALGSMQAMMLAEALYLDVDNTMQLPTRDFFRWITLLVSTPVVFYSGWPFLTGGWRELRARRLGMDSLVAVSVLLAWAASAVETVRGGPHVWFDAAVMFVFFLLAARSLEGFARQRANAVVERLARARPAIAVRLGDDDVREQVPVSALRVGDRVEVAAGGSLPADGQLIDDGEFDEALLTGESRPVLRQQGSTALAGSICISRPVRLRVERMGGDTRLSQLVHAVESAQNQRPALAQWADRIAGYFVAGLFLTALVTFIGWQFIDPTRAFEIALAVLVVSCPCALSLAIPTALVAAHAALAQRGLLSLRADGLQALARIDTAVLDKTGTLTRGQPELTRIETCADASTAEVLAMAAALEAAVQHPLGEAFRQRGASVLPQARACQVHPGRGIEGEVQGRRLRIGRADFAAGREDDGALWLGEDGRTALARFEVADQLRGESLNAVRSLQRLGIEVRIASGDAAEAVAATARAVGISQWQARLQPESKLALLRELQIAGRRVLMVGDGINDAPVLAGADVSVAMGSGASLAHRSSDFVLESGDLGRLAEGIDIARRARRIMRQNLAWALAYNLIALPFAAAGLVPPWLAALGMTASSLLVTFNALRIGGRPRTAAAVLTAPAPVVAPALETSP